MRVLRKGLKDETFTREYKIFRRLESLKSKGKTVIHRKPLAPSTLIASKLLAISRWIALIIHA